MLTGFDAGSTGTLDSNEDYETMRIINHEVIGDTVNLTIQWDNVKMGGQEYYHITKSDMKVHNQEKVDKYWELCGGRERAIDARE